MCVCVHVCIRDVCVSIVDVCLCELMHVAFAKRVEGTLHYCNGPICIQHSYYTKMWVGFN